MSYVPNQNAGGNFVTHLERWLQLRGLMDDLKYRRERREQDRQLFQMDLEDRKRRRAHEDFSTAVALSSIGALPTQPGDTGQNDEAIAQAVNITPENRRRVVNTPVGNYRLPSEVDRYNRARTDAVRAGTVEGLKKKATEEVTDPYEEVPLPDELGGGSARVKKSEALQRKLDLFTKMHPNLQIRQSTPNDAGDVTISGWDPQDTSGKPKFEYIQRGAGK